MGEVLCNSLKYQLNTTSIFIESLYNANSIPSSLSCQHFSGFSSVPLLSDMSCQMFLRHERCEMPAVDSVFFKEALSYLAYDDQGDRF